MDNENAIKELIINDQVLDAIQLMYEQEEDTNLINELIILKSNLITLNKKARTGILSYEEENRALNKIKYELLQLVPKGSGNTEAAKTSKDGGSFSFDQTHFETRISQLTQDQFKVLNFIKKMNRVRISGCAGSGKTLVAAEKAIRLSKQGIQALVLCHNPNLSLKIRKLVSGHQVLVAAFGPFIRSLARHQNLSQMGWNKYYEPLPEELEMALQVIEHQSITFDAVIVDEAQDFREDWWIIIDTVLAKSKNPIFYIFHDDNQALLPFRASYPIEEPVVDLSKNCRNGGKIFDFIKSNFHHQAPEASIEIREIGSVKLFVYGNKDKLKTRVFSAIDWLTSKRGITHPVVLLAGDLTLDGWEFGWVRHSIPAGTGWRREVIRYFSQFATSFKLEQDALNGLSQEELPNPSDIATISRIAQKDYESLDKSPIYAKLGTQIAKSNRVYWAEKEGKSVLRFEYDAPAVRQFFLLKFLANPNWADSLVKNLSYTFTEHFTPESDNIPVFEAASFKGLESDGIVVVAMGQSHSYFNELYVAASRAKKELAIVIDKKNENFLVP